MSKIVEYWPKGYADAEGSKRITIEDDANPAAEVRKVAGPYAEVFSVRSIRTEPVEQFDPEYVRMMSQGG
jgi:hypothetical protein